LHTSTDIGSKPVESHTTDVDLRTTANLRIPVRISAGRIRRAFLATILNRNVSRVNQQPTVFIVDDDPDFRESLSILVASMGLRSRCFSSGLEFLNAIDGHSPGCVILDVRMPDADGLAVAKALSERAQSLPVIIMTAYPEVPGVVRAAQLGVISFLQKHTYGETELWEAIQVAITRDSEQRARKKRERELREQFGTLNLMERRVLDMLLRGCDHMSISKSLDISRRTVENYRSRIMKRLDVENFVDLVALAFEVGLPER